MRYMNLFFASSFAFFASYAFAYNFTPTKQEFNAWSVRCQKLYLSTGVGRRSEFRGRYSSAKVEQERLLSNLRHGGGWHYCTSIIYIKRAKLETVNEDVRNYNLKKAMNEINYTVSRINKRDPWYAEIGVTLGNLFKALGLYEKSAIAYNEVIESFPTYHQAYLGQSLLYRKMGNTNKAIAILENLGNENITKSVEVSYFLGIYYVEEANIEKANYYANIAYSLGYPLPGLKIKLKQLKQLKTKLNNK